jgi:hypothetical protein
MSERHQSHLYVPLLGSGRGGLSPELSFVAVLLGVLDLNVDEVTIVIYPHRRNQMSGDAVTHAISKVTGASTT